MKKYRVVAKKMISDDEWELYPDNPDTWSLEVRKNGLWYVVEDYGSREEAEKAWSNRLDLGPVEERAARGARLLDERRPGWADRIDLNRLELSDCHRCVLGQLFEDKTMVEGYTCGLYKLGLSNSKEPGPKWYGFDAKSWPSEGERLKQSWVKEIKTRTEK